MKRLPHFVLLSFLFMAILNPLFSQAEIENTPSVLDPQSELALQSVPIYEGVEDFSAKVEKIRREKGREPLGLVLCGGSARAVCHVGVLKAMEENDLVSACAFLDSKGVTWEVIK